MSTRLSHRLASPLPHLPFVQRGVHGCLLQSRGMPSCSGGGGGSSPNGSIRRKRLSGMAAQPAAHAEASSSAPLAQGEAAAAVLATDQDHSLDPFRALVADKRFHCTMCGKCCTGSGEVWVSEHEAVRIAAFLNMSVSQFYGKFTKEYRRYKGFHLLKNRFDAQLSCIFLLPDNKCSIHNVRPGQCSTYPWWPELMDKPRWDWEKENICEGFDHAEATTLDVEEAAKQLREATLQEQLRKLCSRRSPGESSLGVC